MNTATIERDASLSDELFTVVGALRRATRRAAGRPFPLDQVAGAQLELVRVVRRRPGVSVTEASAELGLVPNTVSTLVRRLVGRGLLIRTPDPIDRRIAQLSLTPNAQRRAERWRDERDALAATLIGQLSPADRAALSRGIAVISRLASAMSAAATEGPPCRTPLK